MPRNPYNLPRLNHDNTKNMSILIASKQTESVIKSPNKANPDQMTLLLDMDTIRKENYRSITWKNTEIKILQTELNSTLKG